MRHALRTQTSAWALVAGMLWIAGFDVLPLAHIAFHDAFGEHRHGAQHAHDRASGLSGHAHHDHDHGDRHAETADPESELPDPDPEHGRGSLAHRDLAAQATEACLPPVPEARVAYLAPWVSALEDDPSRAKRTATRARAPPQS